MPASCRIVLFTALALAAQAACAALVEVNVEGVDDKLEQNVRAYLSVMDVLGDDSVPASQITYLHGKAEAEIRQALKPFGYYRATVESFSQKTEEGRVLTYVIDEGPPVTVAELDLTLEGGGRDDEVLQEVLAEFPLQEGEILLHPQYESFKAKMRTLLDARGYFAAQLKQSLVVVNPDDLSAKITLLWDTGPRYRFGKVHFKGGQFTEQFLQRFIPFERAEFYSQEDVLELQRQLYNTAYFAHVGVDVQRDEAADGTVPIIVNLVPDEPNHYTAGVSYGTDTGPRIELGYERRWVNDEGHTFRAHIGLGTRRSDANIEYAIPIYERDVREYVFGAALVDEQTESVDRRTLKLNASRVGSWGPWDQIISLNYLREEFRFDDDAGDDQKAIVLYPELRLSRIESNNPLIPTRGWSLTTYVRGGADVLLSDTSFAQVGVRARLILPGWGRDRWLFRGDAATTWAGEFLRLPASLRYFAGGSQSIRGFEYEALGPTNAEGEVIGGEHLLVGSVEYEHMFTEHWGMAVFADAGSAFSNSDFDPEYGAGLGVRWRSPIGTVRLDVGVALSRDNEWMLHLMIGPFL